MLSARLADRASLAHRWGAVEQASDNIDGGAVLSVVRR